MVFLLVECFAGIANDTLGGSRVFFQKFIGTCRAYNQGTATIGAYMIKLVLSTVRAKGALKRTDKSTFLVCRKIPVTTFAIGFKLKHGPISCLLRS